jgi:peptidoglycan/xylan/chitin deacetylase (PgdA/CDA1 family)
MGNRALAPLVLAYHAVGDVPLKRDWYRLFVRPSDLRWQVSRLRGWGYRIVTFGELAAAARSGGADGLAALTFDDGFADNATALPSLLEELEAVATVFVISGWLGEVHSDAPWARVATVDEVRAMSAAGIEIGAHTVSHVDLTKLDQDAALEELAGSKADLEAIIERPVAVAAYPFGATNESVVEACRAAGFVAACGTRGRGSWDEPLNLPRQDVVNRQTRVGFYLKRDDRYERAMRPFESLVASPPGRFTIRVIRRLRVLGRA